uniref:DUF3857 domain-containing protein n=1 Tax=uncultured Altererythrobacter sp. TaxID=500840 RepID=UPI00262EF126|nr:DUF3857 domain-containing protein [uncultured Altererythrobacter sp.]
MNFARFGAAVSIVAVAVAAPAMAGEEVQYGEVPEWVGSVDLDAAIAAREDVVLYDRQVRLDGGVVTRYTDIAYDINSTQALQNNGTLQFSWLPDKGDLTIHRLELIRDGEVIDLLEQGVEPEVIRRERELERRTVDGELTAVVAVPGMKVGDVLRMSTSTTLRDQALQDEMQAVEGVVAEPMRLGFGRIRILWPEGSDVSWGTMGDLETPEVTKAGDDNVIEIALPIEKPEEWPGDAPTRFTAGPALQFGTFQTWEDVSRVMAPHFTVEGKIAPGGEVAAEISRIMAATDVPVERAALALQSVQDEISYLANGMDGGNYLPQSPQETWELRFGDCKAKSLLLLAMLREMDIDADVVLVDSDMGDAVSISLPVPAAFDHMIVRARIDGVDYWMDGTSSGARLDSMYEVPDFGYALPLTDAGSGLVKLEQRWPKVADRSYEITYDMRGGVDLPSFFEVEMVSRGAAGAQLRGVAVETNARELLSHANSYFNRLVGGVVYDAEYSYDDDSGIGIATIKGITFEDFELERNIATLTAHGATTGWSFNPDRARSAWRDIPYQVGGPYTAERKVTYLLPDEGEGAELKGVADVDTMAAGTKFFRQSKLSGETYTINDRTSYIPAEIAATDIRAEKTAMRRLTSGDPKIRITDPTRSWELDDDEIAKRVRPFLDAAGNLVEAFDDDSNMLYFRAAMAGMARDYEIALQDINRAIELGADAEALAVRSEIYANMGMLDEALADAERAFDLQGDIATATSLASLLAIQGRGQEALDLIDSLGLSGDEAVDALSAWSELSGYAGQQEEAWYRLLDMAEERPDDTTVLNASCWMSGLWGYNLEEAAPFCDKAVTLSGQSASILDSRAHVKYRQGDFEGALADLDMVLAKEPGIAASRYLRGLIRIEQGEEKAGRLDILHAKRIAPTIEQFYKGYGLLPD